ncbi:MAG: LysM peptidoglycan-binding domain-containing protein [Bacteroidaceae bacterium]|nr:LysM peptidoglycan-binding domain-containing protein [Bacteroidaceae bacterium]
MNRLFRHILPILLMAVMAQGAMAQSEGHFYHTVTKGQGLYSISRMYGVTEADIIALNPGSETVIKVGQQLRIPQTKQTSTTHVQQAQAGGERFHTIKTGETLYRLTVIYGLTAREICNANPGLSAENFKVGQVIVIPEKKESAQQPLQPKEVTEPNPIATQAVQSTQQSTGKDDNCKTTHLVKRKENIYRISRIYGITELELVNANPQLRERKMQKGEVLCIPYSKAELAKRPTKPTKQEEEVPVVTIPTNEELFADSRKEGEQIEQIKVAVILPFMLGDSITSDQMKMVEFYEGMLLALDSLKREGVSVDLHMYDSGNKWKSIAPILSRPEMQKMNLIIGPVYDQHIAEAAAFAESNGIRMVVPFARQVDAVFTNPYIYQVNTPQSYFYSEVYDRFFMQFPHPNVIFFESPEEKDDDLIGGFKRELSYRNVPYTVLLADTATNKDTIMAHLDIERQNILMMTSEKSGSLNNMIPIFQLLVRDTASTKYDKHLFGYPQYQVYTNNHLASFYEIDTYFYSSFYTNNLLPEAKAFHQKYRRTYSKEIVNRYPKYAILGFDIAYYFLKAMHLYGTDIDNRIGEMKYTPLQTGFKFERVNNWGGFINRKVFFVHFSKDYELQTIDFD